MPDFERNGLAVNRAPSAEDPRLQELQEVAARLVPNELDNALEYLRWRYWLQEKKRSKNP